MKNKSPEYYFKQLYRDLNKRERKGKITNLHFTKFVNFPNEKYIWVANHDYTIGAYPIHYEIRYDSQDRKVYTELHCESELNLQSNGNIFLNIINTLLLNRNFLPQNSSIYKTNAWYRLKGDTGVELNSKIATDILKHLNRIVSLTEGALVKEIDKVWS